MNIADLLARAAPMWIIDCPDLPANWTPRPGALLPVAPSHVWLVPATAPPPWEPVRRLIEGDA